MGDTITESKAGPSTPERRSDSSLNAFLCQVALKYKAFLTGSTALTLQAAKLNEKCDLVPNDIDFEIIHKNPETVIEWIEQSALESTRFDICLHENRHVRLVSKQSEQYADIIVNKAVPGKQCLDCQEMYLWNAKVNVYTVPSLIKIYSQDDSRSAETKEKMRILKILDQKATSGVERPGTTICSPVNSTINKRLVF